MSDLICPFGATLQQDTINCEHATTVIRRGGEETACSSETIYQQCKAVFEQVKLAALAEMGLQDDLLSVPHSSLVKIQFGAVLGLQQALHPEDASAHDSVADIASMIQSALATYKSPDQLPVHDTTQTAIAYKLQRRRKR